MRDNFTSDSVSPSAVPDPCVRDCFGIWFGVRDYGSCDGSYYSLHAHNTILISKSAAKTEAKPASQELRGAPGSEDTELGVLMELEVRNSHLTRPRLALEIWGSDFLYLR